MVSTDAASLSRCSRLQVSTVLWGLVSLGAPPVGGLFKVQSQRFPYFVIGHFVAPTGPKPKRASGPKGDSDTFDDEPRAVTIVSNCPPELLRRLVTRLSECAYNTLRLL
jgi:hypothetical protein